MSWRSSKIYELDIFLLEILARGAVQPRKGVANQKRFRNTDLWRCWDLNSRPRFMAQITRPWGFPNFVTSLCSNYSVIILLLFCYYSAVLFCYNSVIILLLFWYYSVYLFLGPVNPNLSKKERILSPWGSNGKLKVQLWKDFQLNLTYIICSKKLLYFFTV